MTQSPTEDKKPKLSRSEFAQILQGVAQVAVAILSVFAVSVAAWAAWQGQQALKDNSRTVLRQSEDTQLSTAITALGSNESAERVAGLLLLTQNVEGRFQLRTQTAEPPANLHSDYTTALQILSGYIRSQGQAFIASDASPSLVAQHFGPGYGIPPTATHVIPIDINYAGDQVQLLLDPQMQSEVTALPDNWAAIDLSYDELYGQYWQGANFGWITADMVGTDLRGANLSYSSWSKYSHLQGAYLQCADLSGANFGGANLSFADLRGANVQGANFLGARLRAAKLTVVYGVAKWPAWIRGITVLPLKDWKPAACLQDSKFWDNQPAATVSSSPSPRPSPSATPKSKASPKPKTSSRT